MLNKITLECMAYKYNSNPPTAGYSLIPISSSFKIKEYETPSIVTYNHSGSSGYDQHRDYEATLAPGDEVIISYKTGGGMRGWYLGKGNKKHIVMCWSPYGNTMHLGDSLALPFKADWTEHVSNKLVKNATRQMELLKDSYLTVKEFTIKLHEKDLV